MYKKYSVDELRSLAKAALPTPVNLVLDRETVDFLLSLNTNNRRLNPSPERKAMDFRLTTTQARGNVAISNVYRIFAWLLIAHYEGRRNPRIQQAFDWGRIKTMRTR